MFEKGRNIKGMQRVLKPYVVTVGLIIFVLMQLTGTCWGQLDAVRVNEIMTSSSKGVTDPSGEYCDWIELYNESSVEVDIGGCYLSDNSAQLQKWQFPSPVMIPSKGYLLVYVNDSEQTSPVNGPFQTNFNLSKSGEYLALIAPDGMTVLHEFAPQYPPQRADVSYGYSQRLGTDPNTCYYFEIPTPGKINVTLPVETCLPKVIFSHKHGYCSEPFALELYAEEGAQIRYTLDGTNPTKMSGTLYVEPLVIDRTTVLKAVANKPGFIGSEIVCGTWIFLEDVFTQSSPPPQGWPPQGLNNQRLYYGMNPSVVQSSFYSGRLRQSFQDIDTISLVTDLRNLFNAQSGIYVNAYNSGMDWERPASMELIKPEIGDGFQINAGLRIRGGFSRTSDNPKHSFKVYFRGRYGESSLKYPLFDEEGANEFSQVDLRTAQNYSWACNGSEKCTFVREVFSRDLQKDVDVPYTRSRHYHLFINGIYWGLYQTQERVSANYAATYLGGDVKDWDCIHANSASDGSMDAYREFYSITEQGYSGDYSDNYYRVKGLNPDGTCNFDYPVLLDEDNLIKLMLNVYYTADWDSPYSLFGNAPNNLFAIYNRENPDGFKWFRHDSEHTLGVNTPVDYDLTVQGWNRTGLSQFEPMMLHQKLSENPEYRMRFADLAQEQFFDGGVLTPERCAQRFKSRMDEIDNVVVAESARWGAANGVLRTRETWLSECNFLLTTYFPQRTEIVLNQFKKQGWFPYILAPVSSLASGMVDPGQSCTLTAETSFYYTTNGVDPRLPGGKIHPDAIRVSLGGGSEDPVFLKKTFINKESDWSYYDAGETPPSSIIWNWKSQNYDASGWKTGKARLGFGTRVPTNTRTAQTNSKGDGILTVYYRHEFNVDSLEGIGSLNLSLNRDDGAVVYLNSLEILRSNMPEGSISYETLSLENVNTPNEDAFFDFEISSKKLKLGKNVICVEVHQSNPASTDSYFDLELISLPKPDSTDKISKSLLLNQNQKISVRAYSGGEWSALNQYTYRIRQNYESLRISELMYSPDLGEEDDYGSDDYAWLEIYNSGSESVNMLDVQFIEGITYTFPSVVIPPDGYLILAKNASAFSQRHYTNGFVFLSGYKGNLARKGEKLTLVTPENEIIQSFIYSNGWYPSTDKKGHSLQAVNYAQPPENWSLAEGWSPSLLQRGTPGFSDKSILSPERQLAFHGQNIQFVLEEAVSPSVVRWFFWNKDASVWECVAETNGPVLIKKNVLPSDAGLYRAEFYKDDLLFTSMPFELVFVLSDMSDISFDESSDGVFSAQVLTVSPQFGYWQRYSQDGEWERIPNFEGLSLKIPRLSLSDQGLYRFCFGDLWESSAFYLTIIPETKQPTVIELKQVTPTSLALTYSEYVTIESALNIGHYQMEGGASVIGAIADSQSLIPGGVQKVFLQTTPLNPGVVYLLTISDILDISSNSNRITPISLYLKSEVKSSLLRQVWFNCTGTLDSLTNIVTYPNRADITEYIPEFSTPVNWADYYGQRLSGYIIPPESGIYTFWIASDDYSELYLSTNNDPAKKRKIAYVDGWTNPQEWTKIVGQKSEPLVLVANTPYYIEAIHSEGGGGDNLTVRWELPSGRIEEPIGQARFLPAPVPGSSVLPFVPPVIKKEPDSFTCNEGESATFEIWVESASTLTYQWKVNDVVFQEGAKRSFTIPDVSLAMDGAIVRCVVRNFKGARASSAATLSVMEVSNEPPTLKILSTTPSQILVEFEGVLQSSPSLKASSWIEIGTESPVLIDVSESMQFFRAVR